MAVDIKFDIKKIAVVDIDTVRPNTYNPKDRKTKEYEKIKAILRSKGQTLPILVRENDGLEIVDGEQRWTGLTELGAKQILIYNLGKISDAEAMVITLEYEQKVPFAEIPLAKLVVKLYEEYPGLELPYSEQETLDFKNMLAFDWTDYKAELTDMGGEDTEAEVKTDNDKKSIVIHVNSAQFDVLVRAFDGKKNKYILSKLMEAVTVE